MGLQGIINHPYPKPYDPPPNYTNKGFLDLYEIND